MIATLFLLLLGTLFGLLIEKNKRIVNLTNKLLLFVIYLLLFSLGISIGKNKILIKIFFKVGLESLIIAMFGIMGSAIFAYIIQKTFFEKK